MMATVIPDTLRMVVADAVGRPTRLRRVLSQIAPPTLAELRSPPTIDGARIPAWDRFMDGDPLMTGAGPSGRDHSRLRQTHVPEWAELITRKRCNRIIDIRDVGVLGASRTDLNDYTSLSELARTERPSLLDGATPDTIEELLAVDEIRITQGPNKSSDFMQRASWDGRIELCNAGGSRRFAVAHCIAQTLGVTRPLSVRFVDLTVNCEALAALMARFAIYILPSGPVHLEWRAAMDAFGATWYWRDAPPPLRNYKLICLPHNDSRAQAVAQCVDEAGFPRLADALACP